LFELRVGALQRTARQIVLPARLTVHRHGTLELRRQLFPRVPLRAFPGQAALPLGRGNPGRFEAQVFGPARQLRLAELVEQGLPGPRFCRCRLLLGPTTARQPSLFAVSGALAHVF